MARAGRGEGWEPRIRLEADAEARTLTVHDNGIGMSRDEVIANIGTIAKSGTRELMEKVREAKQDATIEKLIGQFGVGFYSSFMVADAVDLVTRRAGEEEATHWRSAGGDRYEIEPAERATHGTTITLHLKPVDEEAGLADFTDEWVLRRVVKRYSDFVAYPVLLPVTRDKQVEVETAEGESETKTEQITEEQRLNSMKPIWTRDEAEVTEDDYKEFYKHVSGDWNDPMERIAVRAEGRFEYRALLFIPAQAPYDLFYVGAKPGLQLYVRRVQIMEASEDLLPHYLRFVKGVVESPDLPLNVSREMLQQDRHIKAIEKNLTKKVLERLAEMAEKEPERYTGTFWPEFGRAVKEGASQDYANRERLLPLLRFASSHDEEALTSLAAYVERMKPDQEEIYYLTAESREVAASSPHLEAFRDQGYEVLFLVDPVDELLVQTVNEFDGKKLKSIGKGTVELGSEEERKEKKEKLEERDKAMRPLLDKLADAARRDGQARAAVGAADRLAGVPGGRRARLQPAARAAAAEGQGRRAAAAAHPRAQPGPSDRRRPGATLCGRRRGSAHRLHGAAPARLRLSRRRLRGARSGRLQRPPGRAAAARAGSGRGRRRERGRRGERERRRGGCGGQCGRQLRKAVGGRREDGGEG